MREIPLTQGKSAVVSEEDYPRLAKHKWCFSGGYAVRRVYLGGGRGSERARMIKMHREITGAPDGMDVDHIDGDGLNNTRGNLRICTRAQNRRNERPRGGKSGFKGVTWFERKSKWRAGIHKGGRFFHLGYFTDEAEAAKAYNEAASRMFGEYAKLNDLSSRDAE